MKKLFPLIILAGLLASCGPVSESDKMISEGRKIFLRKCSSCHGVHAEGKRGTPSLKKAAEHFTDDAIKSFIQNGRGKEKHRMPPVRNITEQEITRVIFYLKSFTSRES